MITIGYHGLGRGSIMELTGVKKSTTTPITKADVVKQLKKLKLADLDLLVVYANLEAFDYIIGGAQTIVEAIYEVTGYLTTIVMPAHSIHQSCPTFFDEALPKKWKELMVKHTPAYNESLSPILSGEVAEAFARMPRVYRSAHPVASYLASGRKAAWFMSGHQLGSMFGEQSPVQKLYAQDAKVLCLGIDYNQLTALHLAEYYADCRPKKMHEAIVNQEGEAKLAEFEDLAFDSTSFNEIGAAYEAANHEVPVFGIGKTTCKLVDYRTLIDFATDYLKAK